MVFPSKTKNPITQSLAANLQGYNLDQRKFCKYCGEDICSVLVSLPCKSSHMVTLFVVGLDFGHIWTLKPNSSELLLYNCHSSPPQFIRVDPKNKFKKKVFLDQILDFGHI